MTVTTQTQEGVTVMKTTTCDATALATGVLNVTFEQYEKVIQASVYIEDPLEPDYIYACIASIATNVVTVTVYKQRMSTGNTWATVATGDLDGEDVVVVADCI